MVTLGLKHVLLQENFPNKPTLAVLINFFGTCPSTLPQHKIKWDNRVEIKLVGEKKELQFTVLKENGRNFVEGNKTLCIFVAYYAYVISFSCSTRDVQQVGRGSCNFNTKLWLQLDSTLAKEYLSNIPRYALLAHSAIFSSNDLTPLSPAMALAWKFQRAMVCRNGNRTKGKNEKHAVRTVITSKGTNQRLCNSYNLQKIQSDSDIRINLALQEVKNCRTCKIISWSPLYYVR